MSVVWLVAALGLLVGFTLAAIAAARGSLTERVVAFQVANTALSCLVVAFAAGLGEPAYLDLALALVLLGLVGTLAFTRFLEHWL
jgi:multisubunit Na+/H+ antiporter MnhF subunit